MTSHHRPRILIVVTSHSRLADTGKETGYYLSEVTHPWHVFTEAGFDVDFVSPRGGNAPMDPRSRNHDDNINAAFINSDDFEKLSNTHRPATVDPGDYAAIWFAGGHGTMWDFPDNEALARIAAAIYEAGGAVGAVCHGPAGLVNVRLSNGSYLVAGKQVAAFTNEEEQAAGLADVVPFLLESKLKERGANHQGAANFERHVEADSRLVTGQNPASALEAARALIRVLENVRAGTAHS